MRILGNSLRLRLSQSELRTFTEHGRVEQTIRFGPQTRLRYVLERAEDRADVTAELSQAGVTVYMPAGVASKWVESDEISVRGAQPIADDEQLSILVEKDFKCLVPRPGEDDYDGFPRR